MSKPEMDQLWDLQGRQAELRRHVLQLTSQINASDRERGVIDITIREMDHMRDETKVYMAVGKMFALRKKDELRTDLVEASEDSLSKDEDRKNLRDQFLNKLKESEIRIDELAMQIDAARAKAGNSAGVGSSTN